MPTERVFQSKLIKELRELFPGCIILKNDPDYLQGFPDLTILYGDKWAILETKGYSDAPTRNNQEYYVNMLAEMSYASFINPENKEKVLYELQQAFRLNRRARVSVR